MGGNSGATLWFTNSESSLLPVDEVTKRGGKTFPGLYSCTLEDYVDTDDDYMDEGERCVNPKRLADGLDTDSFDTGDGKYRTNRIHNLFLMNLEFFLSKSKKNTPRKVDKPSANVNDDGNSYLYAATLYPHPRYHVGSWEILRTDPTVRNTNHGDLQFHSYFKTPEEFEWNECDFDCCPFNTERDRHDPKFLHAYVLGKPRDFAIDEVTGEIFIVWEGYYKNCNPANKFSTTQSLEWTIGVSRLKNHDEDPDCILQVNENGEPIEFDDLRNNFARCTEPVAIALVDTKGHNVMMPYGGFAVIPAASEGPSPGVKPRRSFLLSVFSLDITTHQMMSKVWNIAEGGDVSKNSYERQDVTSTPVNGAFKQHGILSGAKMKLHYNKQTGRPDHLCRSVFNKGIVCMPIQVTEDEETVRVTVTGDQEQFLTEEQVDEFCVPGSEVDRATLNEYGFAVKSKTVTGLDVLWDEDGTPRRIFFGCWGINSCGRLGSIDKGGGRLTEMLPGAYSGDVILLPRELDSATRGGTDSMAAVTSSNNGLTASKNLYEIGIPISLLLTCIALYGVYKKRFSFRLSSGMSYSSTSNINSSECRRAVGPTYMELPVIDSSTEIT